MVLQRDTPLPVWGWAKPGEKVFVTLNKHSADGVADASGAWRVKLAAMSAGGPFELQIRGSETLVFTNILVGDVWLCSGQSNMQWPVKNVLQAEIALAAAGHYPQLRHFSVQRVTATSPQKKLGGHWTIASPKAVAGWTAVGYFFGRDLYSHLNVPIGLIQADWGGTRVEAWTSIEQLSKYADIEDELKLHQAALATYRKAEFETKQKAWLYSLDELVSLTEDRSRHAAFSSVEKVDHDWVELNTPQSWDAQGFKDYYGEAWYRKTVEIPAAWAGREVELGIGQADEIDLAFFNGVKVGGRGSVSPYDASYATKPRLYIVAPELVKAGRTVIAVRVVNLAGQGGLCGNADSMFLRLADDTKTSLPLTGKWRFAFTFRRPDKPTNPESPNSLACLYQALIHPVIPYAIKGVIWYQGENNSHNAYVYRDRFKGMINDWRSRWGQGNFPFLWVQLANFQEPKTSPGEDAWAILRESQDAALTLPNTGMALAIDVGEAQDIHPRDKQTVGTRLALTARSVAYGDLALIHSGPRYHSVDFREGKAFVRFTHVGGGLRVKGGGALQRFSVAGEDKKWFWATAQIEGDRVVVSSEQVPAPAAVRYAFEINPSGANLYNAEGLPAAPFRTDNWRVSGQPQAR